MAVFIILGNTLSIVILLKRRLRNRPHFLLISLAIANLLVVMFAIPLYRIISILKQKLVSLIVFHCADMFTGFSSIFTDAGCISLERLHAITRPLTIAAYLTQLHCYHTMDSFIYDDINVTRVLLDFSVITMTSFLAVIIISLLTPLLISGFAYCVVWRKQGLRLHNEITTRNDAKLLGTLLLMTATFVFS